MRYDVDNKKILKADIGSNSNFMNRKTRNMRANIAKIVAWY